MAKRRRGVKVFLDSSVLFTAVNSPTGGSAKLLNQKNIKCVVSRLVLHEVEKNVRKKLQEVHLKRFFRLVGLLEVVEDWPDNQEIKEAERVIVKKDAVILATAKKSSCIILVTLDRRDFLQTEVITYLKPKKVMTPKMFFEWYD
ncbi:MAG: hypothetical protein ACD_40C00229G0003 [uncultured bacterium]|nr:MAG: hypothetical protein ACD_40C00229G0003 [uncultured bacterium]